MPKDHPRPDEDALADVIADLADADSTLSEDVKLLVLAALDGDDSLAQALDGAYSSSPVRKGGSEAMSAPPVGAFVKSIRARGFRGVGSAATLPLHPAPGLTIVAGRNGSGKSSFSEALELALTGDTYRWKNKKQVAWKQHWRNLHDGEPCEIRVEIAEEGAGTTTVGVDWAKGSGLTDRGAWIQRDGQRREASLRSLGWSRAADLYRPILSYDELGGLLDAGPSTLFDKLDAILGIEQATDAERRLTDALKELQESAKQAKAAQRELKRVLPELDDERAKTAYNQLRKHQPDIDTVQQLATGTSLEPTGDLAQLRGLMQLSLPDKQVVQETAAALRTVADEVTQSDVSSVDIALRRADLVRRALEFHEHRGDGRCPVCGVGDLDHDWRNRVENELEVQDQELTQYQQAWQRLEDVRISARSLIARVAAPQQPGRFTLSSFDDALAAWQKWSQPPKGDGEFAEHLESAFGDLEAAWSGLREDARAVLVEHEDAWAPLAEQLMSWVGLARRAQEKQLKVDQAKSAAEFMQSTVQQLRENRLAHLEESAREIWSALKQESNVDLGRIELKGSATRRRVELHAAVDGAEAEVLGVMSQGELHALALALFLPRATVSASPFRFIVLDDPIQAMDPAKVDAFVHVLVSLAEHRQVIVFSHDDRLTQAVRYLGVPARIVEVCRDVNSNVTITPCLEPARRFLDDAFAVANDPEINPELKSRVLPGVCRMAVEAAARDCYMARRFVSGHRREDVEATWQGAQKTNQRIALALRDDTKADLSAWLDAKDWRRPARRTVSSGAHEGLVKDPLTAVRQVESLVKDIMECAP